MNEFPFGWGAATFIFSYLIFMLCVGIVARVKRKSDSLSEFYLAGKSLGWFVLMLTLYATQYSGNTLVGYPGEAYRLGYAWIMSVGFMIAIIVVYQLFAPRLYRLAKAHNFITPGDWIQYRFDSNALSLVANILLAVAIANFLLAQLIAMGYLVAGLTGDVIPYWLGVAGLALIIIVYETLGGMRAVAWTDCIQGLMLLVGLVGILVIYLSRQESVQSITEWLMINEPAKVAVPSWAVCRTWLSTVLLVGLSGAVYPQALQRIYAARDSRSLRVSLSFMVFMPFASTLVVFLIGIISIQHFPGLDNMAADQVFPRLLSEWAAQSAVMYGLAVVVITGVLAAIMSTADSVLLSLSSIIAKDFLGKTTMKHADESQITRVGKYASWVVMLVLVSVALVPRMTLWGLTEFKMELLAQVAPVIILGTIWKELRARPVLVGIISGTVLAIALTYLGFRKVYGFHAGLLGLALNVSLCFLLTKFGRRSV